MIKGAGGLKIKSLKSGALNAEDRLAIAALLIKAGYAVRIGKEVQGKRTEYYVQAIEPNEDGA